MKTYMPAADHMERKWYLVDAEGQVLGRLAVQIATILRGKQKPMFAPHVDVGDFVVVINAAKVKVTGRKETDKYYYHHSGYVGNLRSRTLAQVRAQKPEDLIRHAVRGMIPKNRLGRKMLKKLKVFPGQNHPHQAQKPIPINM